MIKGTRAIRDATLRLSAALEFGTGIALLSIPGVVIKLLVGLSASERPPLVGRILGGALVSLGIAGLLSDGKPPSRGVICAFGGYNGSIAAILGIAGASRSADGLLLWPVVVFHAGVAAILAPRAFTPYPERAETGSRQSARSSPRSDHTSPDSDSTALVDNQSSGCTWRPLRRRAEQGADMA